MCFRWKSLVKSLCGAQKLPLCCKAISLAVFFFDSGIEQWCIPFKNSFRHRYNLFVIYSCVDISQEMLQPNIQSGRIESGKQLVVCK